MGFAWNPETTDLWGWDNGSDARGNHTPVEELNRLLAGGNYGWPFCFGDRRVDPLIAEMPKGKTREAYCATTLPPAFTYTAHSAPMAFLFYRGTQFPADYQGDAFVAFRGSWNRTPPSGYKVVRVRFESRSSGTRRRFFHRLSATRCAGRALTIRAHRRPRSGGRWCTPGER